MGTWGVAISSNDTYADIYSEFFDLYNDGLEVAEISVKLIRENQEIIDDLEESNNFWFALAKAQWECKQLEKDLFLRIREIIESGNDLEVWRRLEAPEKEIKKRKDILQRFLLNLQEERPKAEARKKKIIRQPAFEKGDCLVFKLENGNYGGAVVLEAIHDTEYGYNLIASTRINQENKPTKNDFENAEILIINYAEWDNKPNIHWYSPVQHKNIIELVEKIDVMEICHKYSIDRDLYGHMGDFGIWFIGVANQQFESEKTKLRPTKRLTIKEMTKRKWKIR
ncbi:hypothetical protein [Dysgonomonas mossii]|uniref:hypothetical protein n=1 Tax=Dysgonomonas mossii TaxID=163665 RepID=UPI003993B6E2